MTVRNRTSIIIAIAAAVWLTASLGHADAPNVGTRIIIAH